MLAPHIRGRKEFDQDLDATNKHEKAEEYICIWNSIVSIVPVYDKLENEDLRYSVQGRHLEQARVQLFLESSASPHILDTRF